MRCKNCGFENESERYICENCGSPLYDEEEEMAAEQTDYSNDPNDKYSDDRVDKRNTRNSIIVIVILAVLLIAMVTGIVILASGGSKTPDVPESDGISTTDSAEPPASEATEPTTARPTTAAPTTNPTTTKPTTERTTEPITEPTTEPTTEEPKPTVAEYQIAVDIEGNGSVTGSGTYEAGNKATLTATANEGSQFAGWYDNATGQLVASSTSYTVTVQKDLSLTAKFQVIEPPTEKETEESTEPEEEETEAAEAETEEAEEVGKTEGTEVEDKEEEPATNEEPVEDDPVIEQG